MRDYAKKQNWNVPVTARAMPVRPSISTHPLPPLSVEMKSGQSVQHRSEHTAVKTQSVLRLRWVLLAILLVLIVGLTARALLGGRAMPELHLKWFAAKPAPVSQIASPVPVIAPPPPTRVQAPEPTVAPPQYDFYQILPDQREARAPIVNINRTGPVAQSGYVIQAGTYGTEAQAGQVKAKLLLLGFSPSLTHHADGSYGVSLGPIATQNGASMIVRRLRSAGLSQITVNYLG